jgi:hypothetical protein
MFDVEISESKRAVLIRFYGQLAEADFAALDALARERQGGPAHDVIFDMTDVQKVQLATEFVAQRGALPQAFTDRQRIYVVPQEDLKLLVRLYAAYQASKGWQPPLIVGRLDEALDRLGASRGDFRPPAASGVL